jgi:diacylglycerol kinase
LRFFKSFKYAFRGIIYCINNERNMRIHTVTALYVFVFSFFFTLSRTSYAVLFLAIAGVMTAELFNTVAEELSDMVAASFNPVVRIVKDMAAGGVLLCALFAAAVGICIFWQPAKFFKIVSFFLSNPLMLLLLLLFTALSIVFIIKGPTGIRDYIRKKRVK